MVFLLSQRFFLRFDLSAARLSSGGGHRAKRESGNHGARYGHDRL